MASGQWLVEARLQGFRFCRKPKSGIGCGATTSIRNELRPRCGRCPTTGVADAPPLESGLLPSTAPGVGITHYLDPGKDTRYLFSGLLVSGAKIQKAMADSAERVSRVQRKSFPSVEKNSTSPGEVYKPPGEVYKPPGEVYKPPGEVEFWSAPRGLFPCTPRPFPAQEKRKPRQWSNVSRGHIEPLTGFSIFILLIPPGIDP